MNNTNKEITGFFTYYPRVRHTTFFEGGLLNILLNCFKYGCVTDSTFVSSVIIIIMNDGRVCGLRRYWHDGRVYCSPVDDTRRSCP